MNRLLLSTGLALVGALGLAFAGASSVAAVQNAPASLSNQIRTSSNAGEFRVDIESFLKAKIESVRGSDLAAAAQAREAILKEIADPAASASFKDEYARQLSLLLPGLLKEGRFFTRLNGAIILEDVARRTGSGRLVEVTTDALGDESAGVAIWAVKAAEPLMAESLARNGNRDPLVPAVIQTVKTFPDNGALAEEAYRTLMIRLTGGNVVDMRVLDKAIPVVVPATLDVMDFRMAQYDPAAVASPETPMAEVDGLLLVSHPATWGRIDGETQTRMMKTLRDLTADSLQTLLAAIEADDDEMRDSLGNLLKRIGSSVQAISQLDAGNANAAALGQAARAVKDLPVRSAAQLFEQQGEALLAAMEAAYPDIGGRGGEAAQADGEAEAEAGE